MRNILITGGSGYLGELLAERFDGIGTSFISIDRIEPAIKYDCGTYYIGNLCDIEVVRKIFNENRIDYVFHFATGIDFKSKSETDLYNNNIASTQNLIEVCKEKNIIKFIFTSSNSVYLGNKKKKSLSENDVPIPIDAYGKSKVKGEELLKSCQNCFESVVFRCPNIMEAGRVGMLSILFDFVKENRKCWMIGNGNITHQCIYAQDLIDAMLKSLEVEGSQTFNIGTQRLSTIKSMYDDLILHANSNSKVVAIPKWLVVPALRSFNKCGISPLGPYQFRMLTEDFSYDTSHIEKTLGWKSTLSNSEMLTKAYDYYIANSEILSSKNDVSANKGKVKMGIISIVKFFS